jgi:hypothetical protein
MRPEHTISEMVTEVLERQAKALVAQTGQSFEFALESVARTEAGRQLRGLADGEYREQRAAQWQASLPWKRAEERHYWWIDDYMEWLEGKEDRTEYYTRLEALASLRG